MEESVEAVGLSSISKSYGDFTAVSNLSLSIPKGIIFGLLGPNGAGKTTTIRMIVRITVPDEGAVTIFSQQLTPKMQERIGYLPEERGLYKKMKVREQLLFLAGLKSVSAQEADKKIKYWTERLEISNWLEKKTDELSKGMQQKIQFISTILHSPELLILDEPFSGLDPINANLLIEVIQELKKSGCTIILSTHVMEQVEKLCDEICIINRSQKVLDGNLKTIKREFGNNRIALAVEGDSSFLRNSPFVENWTEFLHHIELDLCEGVDSQQLLRQVIDSGVRVTRFELVEPSLNEIFIKKVGKSNE
ncbi:MAG: ATP-binding cassette domain-containing protein [Blastocatellia bacterium]|nr:ATP-binding cassette domain-containing protein [Blastocatellia bacterium]